MLVAVRAHRLSKTSEVRQRLDAARKRSAALGIDGNDPTDWSENPLNRRERGGEAHAVKHAESGPPIQLATTPDSRRFFVLYDKVVGLFSLLLFSTASSSLASRTRRRCPPHRPTARLRLIKYIYFFEATFSNIPSPANAVSEKRSAERSRFSLTAGYFRYLGQGYQSYRL